MKGMKTDWIFTSSKQSHTKLYTYDGKTAQRIAYTLLEHTTHMCVNAI